MGAQRAGAPVLTGSVPPLSPFYHARQETGCALADALRPGATVLLVPALLGTGGTGKTQLAIGFAHAMWSARAVDLLAWVPAGNRSALIAGYARAAADLDLLADEGQKEVDAGLCWAAFGTGADGSMLLPRMSMPVRRDPGLEDRPGTKRRPPWSRGRRCRHTCRSRLPPAPAARTAP